MSNVSIIDVARRAGVSTTTVSHVINHTRFVAEETRIRVQQCIDELGYRPNVLARSFKTGHKNLIGFIVPDIANAFFASIIEEVEKTIAKDSFQLIVSNTKETPDRELASLKTLSDGMVDGIILASTLDSYAEMQSLVPDSTPLLFIDRTLAGAPYSSVCVSNYAAMFQAVEKLIAVGHSRIGYITGLTRLSTTQERLSAYRAAMRKHDLPIEEDFIRTGTSMYSPSDENAEKLIAAGCTAIIVSNNVMTDDVLYYLDRRMLRDKITVVGYNDNGYRNYALRGIYSIQQPAAELGRTVGAQIVSLVKNPHQAVRKTELLASFVEPETLKL